MLIDGGLRRNRGGHPAVGAMQEAAAVLNFVMVESTALGVLRDASSALPRSEALDQPSEDAAALKASQHYVHIVLQC